MLGITRNSKVSCVFFCWLCVLPISYRGLQLGGKIIDSHRLEHVVSYLDRDYLCGKLHFFIRLGCRIMSVFIKLVLCYIPNCWMYFRIFSTGVWQIVQRLLSNFMWGGVKGRWKLHFIDWNSISMPCALGHLGVIDFFEMNVALIMKWIFRYSYKSDALWQKGVYVFYEWCISNNDVSKYGKLGRWSTLINIIQWLLC